MALLSIFDLCLSFALALGTVPIPKNTIPYKGPTLGTNGTCFVQGLMIGIGSTGVLDTTLCLAWYYVCRILGLSNWTITRIYEPVFYTYIIASNISDIFYLIEYDWINVKHWCAYCGYSPIPSSCWLKDSDSVSLSDHALDVNCQWPTDPNDIYLEMEKSAKKYMVIEFCLIVLAMLIIVLVVRQNEYNVDEEEAEGVTTSSTRSEDRYYLKEQTHLVLRQASMFVLACLVTWCLVFIPSDQDANYSQVCDVLQTILVPLGGFWNMLIFVHVKIRLVRDTKKDANSNFKTFKDIIMDPHSIPDIVLSGLENVKVEEKMDAASDDDSVGEEGGCMPQEMSRYTSHPSAYDDLWSNSNTQEAMMDDLSETKPLVLLPLKKALNLGSSKASYGGMDDNQEVDPWGAEDVEDVEDTNTANSRYRHHFPIQRKGRLQNCKDYTDGIKENV